MTRNFLLAAVALATMSGAALAADLPTRRAPPVAAPPPPFTWTGFYVGGQAGYQFGRENAVITVPGNPSAAFSDSPNGVVGGGHIGYNFSTQGLPLFGSIASGFGNALGAGVVFGVEGDVDGSDYRRSTFFGAGGPAFLPAGGFTTVREQIQGSARGRLGLAYNRILVYGTGGAAFGVFNTDYNNFGHLNVNSFSTTRVGYTVGGGIEYGVANNFAVRAEYRYSDFGTFSNGLGTVAPGVTFRRRETIQRIQAGFDYKFDTFVPAPVVARY